MIEHKQVPIKGDTTFKEKLIELKPMKKLKGFDFEQSDAFLCDIDTGICGPASQKKEINE